VRVVHITRIGFTPLKGARHLSHEEARLELSGPVGDRTFCLVDINGDGARVLRSVENPTLAAVRASYDERVLTLTLPDGTTLSAEPRDSGVEVKADYWGRPARLWLQDSPHAAVLGDHLGQDVALARAEPGEVVYGSEVTIVNTAALADLAERAGLATPAGQDVRFRATLTVASERDLDDLAPGTRIRVGSATVEVRGHVPRCAVVDRDPATGSTTNPVLRALAGYRRGSGEVWFGLDARVLVPGVVRSGDLVSVEA
jgi:uncharacterized protein YcbX